MGSRTMARSDDSGAFAQRHMNELRVAIRKALVDAGITQKQLAARAGMSEQTLSHFLRGRRKQLRRGELESVAEALGESPEALVQDAARPAAPPRGGAAAGIVLPPRVPRVVPVYPIGAGYGIEFGDGDMPVGESLEDPIVTQGVADPNAFAGKIVGTSMDPGRGGEMGFREGDVIVFDTKAEARSGDYCLVRFAEGGATFKQIFLDRARGIVRLHALNPDVADEERSRAQVHAIYRAVQRLQRL